jgi:hypothetical protein
MVSVLFVAWIVLFYIANRGAQSERIAADIASERSSLLKMLHGLDSVKDDSITPAEHGVINDRRAADEKKREDLERRESEYKRWLKASRMENEGVTPFDSETRGIAGGVQQYYEVFQVYPKGGNREIARALFGENSRKLRILNWPERRLSADGEFLDPWGTPYQIEVTRQKIEIRSAGPNRIFWDVDDQIAR